MLRNLLFYAFFSFLSLSFLFIFFLLFATPSFAIAKENNAKREKNLKNLLFDYIFTLPELISKKKSKQLMRKQKNGTNLR